jgi:LL-diaminopimelate aminotransferase
MLWLNYPNNPTAAVASLEFFAEAVAFARKHDLLLCHDAAYSQVTFNGRPAPSVLQIPGAKQTVVEFNSLSKSHNMPGWRLGVAVGNADALRALFKLKTNVDSGHFLPVMEAAAAALNGDQSWLVDRNEIYRQRRDIVIAGLRAMGLLVAAPQASIYVWSPTPPGWSSLDFVTALLEETQVSLTPGVVFGGRGEGHVRIALTTATDRLEEAMQRLAQWRKT